MSTNNSSIHHIEVLAESGNVEAQAILAARLAKGEGVLKDDRGEVYWYAQAAKLGHVHAKWNLALMILNGEGGIEANGRLAIELVEEAASEGDMDARNFLSWAHKYGELGLERNIALSKKWMNKNNWVDEQDIYGKPCSIKKYLGSATVKPKIEIC